MQLLPQGSLAFALDQLLLTIPDSTALQTIVMITAWRCNILLAGTFWLVFTFITASFFSASVLKVPKGAWFRQAWHLRAAGAQRPLVLLLLCTVSRSSWPVGHFHIRMPLHQPLAALPPFARSPHAGMCPSLSATCSLVLSGILATVTYVWHYGQSKKMAYVKSNRKLIRDMFEEGGCEPGWGGWLGDVGCTGMRVVGLLTLGGCARRGDRLKWLIRR